MLEKIQPVVRPFDEKERQRSLERQKANTKNSLEERVEILEEFMNFMLKQPDIEHAVNVQKMIKNAEQKHRESRAKELKWSENMQKEAETFTPTEFFLKNYGKTS